MKRWLLFSIFLLSIAFIMASTDSEAAKKAKYTGYKKCGGCHKSQKESWLKTKHAKALDILKPNNRVEAKKKLKADPKKDYTKDDDCLPCHTTGYNKRGGYKKGLKKTKAKYVNSVGCETCHGAGDFYRKEHSKAGTTYKKSGKTSPRKKLASLGEFKSTEDIQEACFRCHMNYEGSPWEGAKPPYAETTPDVDPKYKFDFDKAVKNDKAMHDHFKLKNVFKGKPIFKYRDEFQKSAKEPAASEEEE